MSSEETVFKDLSHRGSVILGFEVANHVLSHLAGAIVKEGIVGSSQPLPFSAKVVNLIQYPSGYVLVQFIDVSGDQITQRICLEIKV